MKLKSPLPKLNLDDPPAVRRWNRRHLVIAWLYIALVVIKSILIVTIDYPGPYLAISIAAGAVAFAAIVLVATKRSRVLRKARQHEFLLCPQCVYILQGLPSEGNCPECGQPYTLDHVAVMWRESCLRYLIRW
jgi:hypothetical protein